MMKMQAPIRDSYMAWSKAHAGNGSLHGLVWGILDLCVVQSRELRRDKILLGLSPVSCSIRQELRDVLQGYLHALCVLCRLSIALGDF
jgi:hypothetical protein